jgi:hypothetical protein
MRFQVHCPPLEGVLLIFRSRYWFAIGRQGVLSLAGWAPRVQARFHVSGLTQVPNEHIPPSSTGLSPSPARHSRRFHWGSLLWCPVLQPQPGEPGWFGLVRFRSPLLTESRFRYLTPGTVLFELPRVATCAYGFSTRLFGNLGIIVRLTTPPSFSQSSTPFIASWRQDIPRTASGRSRLRPRPGDLVCAR